MSTPRLKRFCRLVWNYYRAHKRDFAWRCTHDPYRILISEVMLQQTQTSRVERMYPMFLKLFPTVRSLAKAKTGDVLRAWQGMGYNRRALNLLRLAQAVVKSHKSKIPRDPVSLDALPGIGVNTAGAVMTFAFNRPVPFIETNIRRTFIHFFFPKKKKVSDDAILELVAHTIDKKNPRGWFYALMDYGAMLAGKVENPNRRSRHYRKQSRFEGSDRQLRGRILVFLLKNKLASRITLIHLSPQTEVRADAVIQQLLKERFIVKRGDSYGIAK